MLCSLLAAGSQSWVVGTWSKAHCIHLRLLLLSRGFGWGPNKQKSKSILHSPFWWDFSPIQEGSRCLKLHCLNRILNGRVTVLCTNAWPAGLQTHLTTLINAIDGFRIQITYSHLLWYHSLSLGLFSLSLSLCVYAVFSLLSPLCFILDFAVLPKSQIYLSGGVLI